VNAQVHVSTARTVDQAIAAFVDNGVLDCHYSHFRSDLNGAKGDYRPNLTTTTASGYTNANDWLAKAMGQGPAFAFASAQSALTSVTSTTATNSGATFPTAGQGLAGSIVVVGANASGTGSVVYGVIVSNTGTQLTVDQWYSGTSTTGAAGTTPNATGQYIILPGQNPAAWLAVSNGAHTPLTSDTTLTSELTGSGFTRAVGSYSHTAAAGTYSLTYTWTASGTQTIINEAQFGACNTTAGGVMPFESAEPSSPTLVSGDTLQNSVTVTI
jgi:hypothetical protein